MPSPNYSRGPTGSPVNLPSGPTLAKLIGAAILVFVVVLFGSAGTFVVEPGTRGIKVTLGKVTDKFLPEGFGFKMPLITHVVPVTIKQRTTPLTAQCFSSDLQQVMLELRVLYRVPEGSVVQIFKQYAGDPFDSLIAPRIQEAMKEITAAYTAEQIVKDREAIKQRAITAARQKIGQILSVEDIVIRNIDLSHELEAAIEAKMVAEQEAARARFTQLLMQVEADTAVIRARGEAEAIRIRGEALKLNPAFLRLQIVEKWNGHSPLVIPQPADSSQSGLLLPLAPSPVSP